MDILEKIGGTIIHVGKDVTQKAKDVSGIARLKLDIRFKEDTIKEQYMEIGKSYYERCKGTDVEEKDRFDRIDEALAAIEQMELQIMELKKTKKCPSCGAKAADGAAYCSACGAKLFLAIEEENKTDDTIDD